MTGLNPRWLWIPAFVTSIGVHVCLLLVFAEIAAPDRSRRATEIVIETVPFETAFAEPARVEANAKRPERSAETALEPNAVERTADGRGAGDVLEPVAPVAERRAAPDPPRAESVAPLSSVAPVASTAPIAPRAPVTPVAPTAPSVVTPTGPDEASPATQPPAPGPDVLAPASPSSDAAKADLRSPVISPDVAAKETLAASRPEAGPRRQTGAVSPRSPAADTSQGVRAVASLPNRAPTMETLPARPARPADRPGSTLAVPALGSGGSALSPAPSAPTVASPPVAPRKLPSAVPARRRANPAARLGALDTTVLRPLPESSATENGQAFEPSPGDQPGGHPVASDVVRFIKSYESGRCFAAMPSRARNNQIVVEGLANSERRLTDFNETIAAAVDAPLTMELGRITDAQCRALSFLSSSKDYPVSALQLQLDQRSVESGAELAGVVSGIDNRLLTVLVVDDEGVVQRFPEGFFVERNADSARFRVPLTATAGLFDTANIALAIASSTPLQATRAARASKSDTYFAKLADELAESRHADSDVAFAFFYIRGIK